MSSTRFPGKVLAPLAGRPIIAWVIEQVARAVTRDRIVVATSTEVSDDPLVGYVQQLGISVFRGPLDDVFARLQLCLAAHPCAWLFRITADSPLLNSAIMTAMLPHTADAAVDLVTNVQKRTFPHGHSVELLNARTFAALDMSRLAADEREHVTKFYYAHPDEFRIVNLETTDTSYGALNFAVDTLDDLRRVEALEHAGHYDFTPQMAVTRSPQ
jgi:spore coat polysaccharide biosynthesis protein SpsF